MSEAKLTISVCTYRRFDWLAKCLAALQRQTLPAEAFRVLVVDNSLQPEVSAHFRDRLPPSDHLDYIITEKAGLSYARNVALARCTTPIIAYLDDDALAAPDWAVRILDTFERYHGAAGIVGGKVRPIFETPKPGWLGGELLLYLAIPDWGDDEQLLRRGGDRWLVGASIAYDAHLLRRAGGFPEQLGRDGDLLLCHEEYWVNEAIRAQGAAVVYNPLILAEHLVQRERLTARWLSDAAFWEGVSWMVCCNLAEARSVLDVTGNRAGLIATLERLRPTLTSDLEQAAIYQDCLRFKEAGRAALRALGLKQDVLPPALAAPTLYLATTCRDAAASIEQTLASVIQQAGDFYLRYHVQDAGSSDETLAVLERWRTGIANATVATHCKGVVFSYASERDGGMYEGIGKAFARLDIDDDAFMTWLNADDKLFSGALATVADIQRKFPEIDWLTGEIYCTRQNGGLCQATACGFPRWIIQQGLCETRYWQFLQQEGTFWRKRLWDRVGGLNAALRLAGDFDLWRRFAEHAELWHFLGPLASFHRRAGQLSEDLGRYCAEIDELVPRAAKETAWQWLVGELARNPDKLTIACLYYDWCADAYLETYPSLRDFAPPWKKELFKGGGSRHAFAPPTPASAQPVVAAVAAPVAPEAAAPPAPSSAPAAAPDVAAFEIPARPAPPRDTWRSKLRRRWGRLRDYRVLRRSGIFLDAYYLDTYPDVAGSGVDPLLHYLRQGWREGRNPNPLFSTTHYLRGNPDVEAAGINPLLHYVLHGHREGREPSPLLARNRILALTPLAASDTRAPLEPYLRREAPGGVARRDADRAPARKQPPPIPPSHLTPRPRPAKDVALTIANFAAFAYSKRSHLPLLEPYARELGRDGKLLSEGDLCFYQKALVYAFIRLNVPPGSRILEIGNGHTRVFEALASDYEVWALVRPERQAQWAGLKGQVRVGRLADGVPGFDDGHFDAVYSVDIIERWLPDDRANQRAAARELMRLLKPGAPSLHTFSAVLKQGRLQIHPAARVLASPEGGAHRLADEAEMARDPDLLTMSRHAYESGWQKHTGQSMESFGTPMSINLLGQKHTECAYQEIGLPTSLNILWRKP